MEYKITAYLLILIFFCNGCISQVKTNTMDIKKFGVEIINEVQRYPNEPMYYIGMYSNKCSFQVLINDMPIWSFFKEGGMSGTMLPINVMVSKSGQQTITIKVYPSKTPNKILGSVIDSNARLQISLSVTDWKNKLPMKLINKSLILLPVINGNAACVGLPYAVYSTTFDLQVPYETRSWEGGVNLTKENSSMLQKEVLAIYQKVRQMWADKELLKIFIYNKKTYFSALQSQYRDSTVWKEYSNDLVKLLNNKTFEMEPLEHYVVNFYANGKVVALQRSDLWNRNRSALLKGYTRDNGDERTETEALYLYRPSKNSPLEPIR